MKKGMSPILATVILFAGAIVLFSVMYKGVSQVSESAIQGTSDLKDSSELIDFVVYSPEGTCSDLGDKKCYKLFIENKENREVGYVVRTIGDAGIDSYGPEGVILQAYGSKSFNIYFSKDKVGNPIISEVVPVTY